MAMIPSMDISPVGSDSSLLPPPSAFQTPHNIPKPPSPDQAPSGASTPPRPSRWVDVLAQLQSSSHPSAFAGLCLGCMLSDMFTTYADIANTYLELNQPVLSCKWAGFASSLLQSLL